MKKEITIATLLKDCPKGTKLYSPAYGEVTFEELYGEDNLIAVLDAASCRQEFFNDGSICNWGECLLFPSKEVRNWNYWQADYIKLSQDKDKNLKMLKLLSKEASNHLDYSNYGNEYIAVKGRDGSLTIHSKGSDIGKYILSTGTELKLEEERHEFKEGDVVLCTTAKEKDVFGVITFVCCEGMDDACTDWCVKTAYEGGRVFSVFYSDIKRRATPEEIVNWNKETLQPNHLHYSKSKRKIIDWFNQKDDVVVRSHNNKEWRLATFSHYSHINVNFKYCADSHFWEECLPYNKETAKLIGTTDNWEE